MSSGRVVFIYYVTMSIVLSGVAFGVTLLPRQSHPKQLGTGFVAALCNWDGVWYSEIANDGYRYSPDEHSRVAFFPAFPLLARGVSRLTGVSIQASLLLVSQVSLLLGMLVFGKYLEARPDSSPFHSLFVCALWPAGLFLRVAYAESLFLMITALVLYGIQCRWNWVLLALLVSAGTATRTVGVALLLPVIWDFWCQKRNLSQFVFRAFIGLPLCLLGLLAYVGYQYHAFGAPLAFVQTQTHWSIRPDLSGWDKVLSVILLEAIWSVYLPSSAAYWARPDYKVLPWFNFQFWNPVYFVAIASTLIYGVRTKLLTTHEWILGAGLLAIPFVFQGYRMAMYGHGRFTCVVLPAFIVIGQILQRQSQPVQCSAYCLMAVQLFYWSALFAAWYRVF
jgi:hypothetical protein